MKHSHCPIDPAVCDFVTLECNKIFCYMASKSESGPWHQIGSAVRIRRQLRSNMDRGIGTQPGATVHIRSCGPNLA